MICVNGMNAEGKKQQQNCSNLQSEYAFIDRNENESTNARKRRRLSKTNDIYIYSSIWSVYLFSVCAQISFQTKIKIDCTDAGRCY